MLFKLNKNNEVINILLSYTSLQNKTIKHERMTDSNYESSSGEEDEDGEEEYVEKIEFTEWFPPDR